MKNRALRRSFSDFKRHPWLHMVSILTISVSLLVLGTFFLVYRNFEAYSARSAPQVTGSLYLIEDLSREEVSLLKQKIVAEPLVAAATFKSRDQVIDELGEFLGESGHGLGDTEMFPDVLELSIKATASDAQIKELKSKVSKYIEVKEADFSQGWAEQYNKVKSFFSLVGVILVACVLIGCAFITANFMGIRHQARKHEIEVVRLIGGSDRFIVAPFLLEGLIEGLLGSILALLVLFVGREVVGTLVSVKWATMLGMSEISFLSAFQVLGLIGLGILMACLGGLTVFFRFQEDNA